MLTLTLQKKDALIRQLPISDILPSPHQPRKNFDPDELKALAHSIAEYGVLQPLIVRPHGERYTLIAGERRLRAALVAGLTQVPCILYEKNAEDCAVATLVENLQRQNLSFWEEAYGYRALLREFGMTQSELADKVGKSQSAVANKLRLLRLPPPIQNALSAHGLTERHARALLRLADDEQIYKATDTIIEREYTVSQTEQYIERLLHKPEKPLRTAVVRDLRLCRNTIAKAVGLIRHAGIDVASETHEKEDYIEYIIRVAKTVN